MYEWKTEEYRAYVEKQTAMVEKQRDGVVISAAEQLEVAIAFTTAQVAATEVK